VCSRLMSKLTRTEKKQIWRNPSVATCITRWQHKYRSATKRIDYRACSKANIWFRDKVFLFVRQLIPVYHNVSPTRVLSGSIRFNTIHDQPTNDISYNVRCNICEYVHSNSQIINAMHF